MALHDTRIALRNLPNLEQSSDSQRAVMTGTDGDFLHNSCFLDAHNEQSMDASGQGDINNNSKTQLRSEKDGKKTIPLDLLSFRQ